MTSRPKDQEAGRPIRSLASWAPNEQAPGVCLHCRIHRAALGCGETRPPTLACKVAERPSLSVVRAWRAAKGRIRNRQVTRLLLQFPAADPCGSRPATASAVLLRRRNDAVLHQCGEPTGARGRAVALVHGDHREIATVRVPNMPMHRVLRGDPDPYLHRGPTSVIYARLEGHQLSNVDRFPEDHAVHGESDGHSPSRTDWRTCTPPDPTTSSARHHAHFPGS